MEEIQELLKKYDVEYFGRIQTENLGEYVDFQKIEEPVKQEANE